MATILCAYSGIEYRAEHFPIYLQSRECAHPIFSIPPQKLLAQFDRWADGVFTPTENYLLYLALFNSSELVEFHVPAIQTYTTQSIIAQNMEALFINVEKIINIGIHKAQNYLNLPKFCISTDTRDLSNSKYWLDIWNKNFLDYQNHYRSSTLEEKLAHKELLLEKLIKDKTKDILSYANQLAEWAALAGNFNYHAGQLVPDENNKPVRLADYWKRIIKACAKTESIYNIPDVDLEDLILHCEDYIDHGSIFAHTLMTLLREGVSRKKDFLDLGDIDINSSGTTFRILDADTSVEDANILALINTAPAEKPVLTNYPNKLAFLRAQAKWNLAQNHRSNLNE